MGFSANKSLVRIAIFIYSLICLSVLFFLYVQMGSDRRNFARCCSGMGGRAAAAAEEANRTVIIIIIDQRERRVVEKTT